MLEQITDLDAAAALPFAGFAAGFVLGAIARLQRLCTLSSMERAWYGGDDSGLRVWALAAATAIAATQALAHAGLVDLSGAAVLSPRLGLLTAAFGGLMFGVGMALVGTCSFGALVRLGGGSLGALVVLTALGLAALATQSGQLAGLHAELRAAATLDLSVAGDQSLGALVRAGFGYDPTPLIAAAATAALALWALADARFREQTAQIGAGVAIGATIAFGWLVTSLVAAQSFEAVRIEAASFVGPAADALRAVALASGPGLDYGVGAALGVVAGAAFGAWRRRDVRWEACDDARELGRHLLGGVAMGVGGTMAVGCTFGQGLSALSALALSAPIVIACIALGARLGLAWLVEGSLRGPFRRIVGPAE